MKRTTLFVLTLLLSPLPLLAFDPPDGHFDTVRGTVTEVLPGDPATIVRVDAGSGAQDFFCYETYSPSIRSACLALDVGDEVVLAGDFYFGVSGETSWLTFLVTSVYEVRTSP